MIAGTHRYDSNPIYWLPQDAYKFPTTGEVFSELTDQAVNGVMDYYLISNCGRLFHKFKQVYLVPNIDSKGYLYKPLALQNGSQINCRIHRLVMMTFCYEPGCENLDINHKDGNKCNNDIWNLEWSTRSQNNKHAWDLGLRHSRLSEDKVREICELLQNTNMTSREVSEITGVNYGTISGILGGRIHSKISKEYNLQPKGSSPSFNVNEVESLCRFFEKNKKDSQETIDDYISKAISCSTNIPISKTSILSAKRIYWKETYKTIVCKYNF